MPGIVYNLTQHTPTPSQKMVGVQAPVEGSKPLLTFSAPGIDVQARALALCDLLIEEVGQISPIGEGPQVMIGGIPRLMGPLERTLIVAGFRPVYSFSLRSCVETPQEDGAVQKTYVFNHMSFDNGSYSPVLGGEPGCHTVDTLLRQQVVERNAFFATAPVVAGGRSREEWEALPPHQRQLKWAPTASWSTRRPCTCGSGLNNPAMAGGCREGSYCG